MANGNGFDSRRMVRDATDAITVKRVYGKPYQRNGVVVIPAARIGGGFGGGGGHDDAGSAGSGFGLGLGGQPVGAFVIRGNSVRWKPALDLNGIILRTQAIALAGVIAFGGVSAIRRRLRR